MQRFSTSHDSAHEGRIGIIDIGSHSIRLVVYDGIKRTPQPLYNEKVFCCLGKGLQKTGLLNPEGVRLAKDCILRLLTIVRLMEVVELKIIATAAVRDAKDGEAFVKALERKYNIEITVISGKREARMAAEGIMAAFYEPVGLAGDLGGGSIELIDLKNHSIRTQATLPIGPLRLIDATKGDTAKIRRVVRKHLSELSWLKKGKFTQFYAIGGSFRSLAHIHMNEQDYPLALLHHYTVDAAQLRPMLTRVLAMSESRIGKLPDVPAKRAYAMKPAAIVLNTILEMTGIKEVVFSTSGIREGYLFEKLSPHMRAEDPLIASATDIAAQWHRKGGYSQELMRWAQPLFARETKAEKRLRQAHGILSEIAQRIHTEYRAEWALHHVLQSSLVGVTHRERVMLALSLYHRYQPKLKHEHAMLSLTSEEDRAWARAVGIASNLAYHLSGATPGNLAHSRLRIKNGAVDLYLAASVQALRTEAVKKRLDGLDASLKAVFKRRK